MTTNNSTNVNAGFGKAPLDRISHLPALILLLPGKNRLAPSEDRKSVPVASQCFKSCDAVFGCFQMEYYWGCHLPRFGDCVLMLLVDNGGSQDSGYKANDCC